jgi:hypothetical protein
MNLMTSNIPLQDITQAQEVSRLLTAAVVSPEFCTLLLTNPPIALLRGYNGESFNFEADIQAQIASIQATSLKDFAAQLINGRHNDKSQGPNGNHQPIKQASTEIFLANYQLETSMVVTAGG